MLKYGFDCERNVCSYVYDVESIVNMDLEARKMSVSDYELKQIKANTEHIETESFEDIKDPPPFRVVNVRFHFSPENGPLGR